MPASDADRQVAAASAKPSEAIVKKVSDGMMRLESRRKLRVFARRLLHLLVIAAICGGIWYFWGDRIPWQHLREQWDDIHDKLFPDYSVNQVPRGPS